MKTKLIFFSLICFNLSFSQQNQSLQTVLTTIAAVTPAAPNEIFRFRPGNVTQLDLGSGFGFGTDRWFSMGRVGVPGGQTFYGARFQTPNNALVMGYTSTSPNNPRIEWITNGVNACNLEFRVGTGFGTPGNPGTNTLVATMTSAGNTVFAATPSSTFLNSQTGRVGIISNGARPALVIQQNGNSSGQGAVDVNAVGGTAVKIKATTEAINVVNESGNAVKIVSDGTPLASFGLNVFTTCIDAKAQGAETATGLRVEATGSISGTGITTSGTGGPGGEGIGITATGTDQAGLFNGDVNVNGNLFVNSVQVASDRKLKNNIIAEVATLEKISSLKPVTYNYKNTENLKLPAELQHGFVAQEIEKVFPELIKETKLPSFDKNGKKISEISYKTVNYVGLVSVLTASIQELNTELQLLKEKIAALKNSKSERKGSNGNGLETKGAFLQQNIPNPFADQTTITYQLPEGTNQAEIMVFDLTEKLIKTYSVNKNQSELTIKASDIGSGLFIYSLVQNGQELLSKKMVVKF